jgi:hypothetical protein
MAKREDDRAQQADSLARIEVSAREFREEPVAILDLARSREVAVISEDGKSRLLIVREVEALD